MKTYLINIRSELPFQFCTGNLYLIRSNKEFNQKEEFASNDAVYLNYPFREAAKIIPFLIKRGVVAEKDKVVVMTDFSSDFGKELSVVTL